MTISVGELELLPHPLPDLGGEIVRFDYEAKSGDMRVQMMMPRRPTRDVWADDEDGEPFVARQMTDEEFAEAMASYERASAEWNKTNGVAMVKGPIDESATVYLKDGRVVDLRGDGKAWRVVGWRREAER